MKKILFAAAVLFCCVNASAQRFNVGAGFLHGADFATLGNTTSRYGTNGGFVSVGADIPLDGALTVDTALRFLFQGSRENNVHYSSMALNLPFHGKYSMDFGSGIAGVVFLGPTLWTTLSTTEKVGNVTVNLVGSDGIYKRFDILAGAGAGVEIDNRIRLKAGYDRGLLNYSATGNTKRHRSLISVGIHYMF